MGIAKIRSILKGSPFYFLIFLLIATFQILENGPYLITGNIHDQLLGINSGYFTYSGAKDLLSPLGPIYHYFNFLSYSIVKLWEPVNRIGEIIPISSFLFCLLISLFFFLTSLIVKNNKRGVDSILFLTLLTIAFSFRNLGNFDLFDLNWYGTYNYHMFSLLILNIFLSLSLIDSKSLETNKRLLTLLLQALITLIALLYKINFGLANIVILASSILFSQKSNGFKFFSALGAGAVIVAIGSAILAIYPSSSWHFKALNSALLARAETVKFDLLFYCLFCGVILYFTLVFSGDLNWEKIKSHILKMRSEVNLSYFFFSGCFSVALFLGIGGVWKQPKLLLVVTILLILRRYLNHHLKKISWLIALFVSFNLYSNALLTKYKTRDFSKSFKYKTYEIPAEHLGTSLKWVTYNGPSFNKLSEVFKLTEDPLSFFKLSYSYNSKSGLLLFFSQGDYALSTNEGIQKLSEYGFDKNKRVMTVDFINPFSIFNRAQTTTPSWHWVHLGTTIADNGDELFYNSIENAEVVMLRTLSFDHNDQTRLNCFFYMYNNERKSPFEIFHMSPFWIYLKKKEVAGAALPQSDLMLEEAYKGCLELLKYYE